METRSRLGMAAHGSAATRAVVGVVALVGVVIAATIGFRVAWGTTGSGAPTEAQTSTDADGPSPDTTGSKPTPGSVTTKRASPAATEAIISSAQSYQRQGDSTKAETVLSEAVRQYVEEQPLRIAYGDVLLTLGRVSDAYEQYLAALSIGPRTPKLEATAGTIASMAGKLDRATEHYQAAQNAEPTNAEHPLFLAQVQIKLGQIDAAKASLLRSAKLDPNSARAWGTMAELAIRENNLSVAMQHISKARKLEPASVAWRLVEARALTRMGQPGKAVELLVTLDDSLRFQGPVLKQIGECYGMLSKPLDAGELYAKASDASPADAELAVQTAEWFQRGKQTTRALEFARRAAELGNDAGRDLLTSLTEGG